MNEISIKPSKIAYILFVMMSLLIIASAIGQFEKYTIGHDSVKGLVPLFYVGTERNIPTFFQSLLMLFSALILSIITLLTKKQKDAHFLQWAILSLGFLYMAYDEAFQVHEKLIAPARMLMGKIDVGIYYVAWVLPGIVFVLIVALFYWRFLLHLPKKTMQEIIMAAAIYLGGAFGLGLRLLAAFIENYTTD